MKRFYLYSYLLTLVIIGCGPELRTVVERDKFNRIILEAELKGEVDTNWVKLHTYHFIGPSTDGPPLDNSEPVRSDVNIDESGNLSWGAEEEPIKPDVLPPETAEEVLASINKMTASLKATQQSLEATSRKIEENNHAYDLEEKWKEFQETYQGLNERLISTSLSFSICFNLELLSGKLVPFLQRNGCN